MADYDINRLFHFMICQVFLDVLLDSHGIWTSMCGSRQEHRSVAPVTSVSSCGRTGLCGLQGREGHDVQFFQRLEALNEGLQGGAGKFGSWLVTRKGGC